MEYSICIRTLGNAGEKYEKLIESIKNLHYEPKEVIIVIPKGYELPKTDLKNKRVIYSEKGMLFQRIIGYESATSDYVLLLDDDVQFEKSLVDKLIEPIKKGLSEITFPIYEDLLFKSKFKAFVSACSLASFPSKKDRKTFVKIMSSGGSKYNSDLENSEKFLYSESAPGMCVFAERRGLLESDLREELWIDRVDYPLREDAILIYKAFLNKNRIIGVKNINIDHLDGGGTDEGRNLKASYANSFNHLLFWKRFIYKRRSGGKKLIALVAIFYWAIMSLIFMTIKFLKNFDFEFYKISIKGIFDGIKEIRNFN